MEAPVKPSSMGLIPLIGERVIAVGDTSIMRKLIMKLK